MGIGALGKAKGDIYSFVLVEDILGFRWGQTVLQTKTVKIKVNATFLHFFLIMKNLHKFDDAILLWI